MVLPTTTDSESPGRMLVFQTDWLVVSYAHSQKFELWVFEK